MGRRFFGDTLCGEKLTNTIVFDIITMIYCNFRSESREILKTENLPLDNTNLKKGNNRSTRRSPSTSAKVILSLVSVLFSAVICRLMNGGFYVDTVFVFIITVALQSFLLHFVRSPFMILLPCAALIGTGNLTLSLLCVCAITLCSAAFALAFATRVESFRFFIICTLVYSVVFVAGAVYSLMTYFGSVSAGLETLSEWLVALVRSFASEYSDDIAKTLVEVSYSLVYMLPAVLFEAAVISAWLTKWTLGILSRVTHLKKGVFHRETQAPATLAVVFLLIAVFSFFITPASVGLYYSVASLKSVLSLIFMGEGVREYLKDIRTSDNPTRRFTRIALGVAIVTFMPIFIVSVASYYGVYRTFRKRVRVVRITKD